MGKSTKKWENQLTTKGVSRIILIIDSVSGWILWSNLASWVLKNVFLTSFSLKIFSGKYLHKVVVVDGAFIHNSVQIWEVPGIFYFSWKINQETTKSLQFFDIFVKLPVQVNVVGITAPNKIVFGTLKKIWWSKLWIQMNFSFEAFWKSLFIISVQTFPFLLLLQMSPRLYFQFISILPVFNLKVHRHNIWN